MSDSRSPRARAHRSSHHRPSELFLYAKARSPRCKVLSRNHDESCEGDDHR